MLSSLWLQCTPTATQLYRCKLQLRSLCRSRFAGSLFLLSNLCTGSCLQPSQVPAVLQSCVLGLFPGIATVVLLLIVHLFCMHASEDAAVSNLQLPQGFTEADAASV